MRSLLLILIGLFCGTALGYLLLRVVLPPILSRMLDVRERYLKMQEKMKDLKIKIHAGKEKKEDLTNEIDDFLKKHGIS